MTVPHDLAKLSVRQFAERFRGEMIPLSNTFSYFCASTPLSEDDLKEYLEEPVAALPPKLALPKISILLVPYLERANGKDRGSAKDRTLSKDREKPGGGDFVAMEKPADGKTANSAQVNLDGETVLAFALKDQEVAEYHYRFYHLLATVLGEKWSEETQTRYSRILREELSADAHGEVDEPSWRLKQGLRRSQKGTVARSFQAYARQSFIDTMTLYLHGICCDIDVDTGPRQLPSRYLRKRLVALEEMFPPPAGYALFPEQLEP
ncbi:MAG TPA: hypothetical protein VGN17_23040 [Bryobacteraceae bacterium]|jgi:hypothetical protein